MGIFFHLFFFFCTHVGESGARTRNICIGMEQPGKSENALWQGDKEAYYSPLVPPFPHPLTSLQMFFRILLFPKCFHAGGKNGKGVGGRYHPYFFLKKIKGLKFVFLEKRDVNFVFFSSDSLERKTSLSVLFLPKRLWSDCLKFDFDGIILFSGDKTQKFLMIRKHYYVSASSQGRVFIQIFFKILVFDLCCHLWILESFYIDFFATSSPAVIAHRGIYFSVTT